MSKSFDLRNPWLVAVWPGMGNVALGAGSYLVEKLAGLVLTEFDAQNLFDVEQVDVKGGIVSPSHPASLFYLWKDPAQRRDLVIYMAGAQPSGGGYALCEKLLDFAQERGIQRVVTFAAMATQLEPGKRARVFGVATDEKLLKDLKVLNVEVMEEGQISGLNGVMLAAAIERGVGGVCLLGEMPFFAVNVPNPRASQAVLEMFSQLAGIELDFTQIARQAKAMDKRLRELLKKLKQQSDESSDASQDEQFTVPEFATDDDEEAHESRPEDTVDHRERRRIEVLFKKARQDRSKAMELKQELDRLGIFADYEDRFLDLFKKGE